ncbi:MAG: DUF2946 family protein [Pseudolabrys sp.]
MPTAFISPFRRRLIAVIALWLIVLQSFLAGVATAQAGAAVADPLAAAVICHGGGESGPAAPASPNSGAVWHLCCSYCLAAAPGLLPLLMPAGRADVRVAAVVLPLADFVVVIARETVRAGPSQGPPGQA